MSLKFPISLVGKRGGAGGAGVNLSYVNSYSSGATLPQGSPFTFSSCDLGDPAPNRQIVVCLTFRAYGSFGTQTVTVGGVNCSLDLGDPVIYGENFSMVYIFRASVPNGATGDISITTTGSSNRNPIISIYRMEADNLIVRDTDVREVRGSSGTTPRTVTVDAVNGSGVIAFATRRVLAITPFYWSSGVTNDHNTSGNYVMCCSGHTNILADDSTYDAILTIPVSTYGPALVLLCYESS
jgi:hypothetical protein